MVDVIEQAVGEIIIRDGTAAGVRSATANFNQLYNIVRNNWWGIQNLGHAFAGLGGVIAGGLAAGVKAAISFDQGMKQVSRTADISGKDLEEMGNALRNLALQKPISVDALTKIAADAAALGIDGVANISAFTGTIADLISTTNLTEESAVQLARLAGPLGIQGQDWERLGSAILYAGVNSAATEKDIVNMAVRLTGAASAAHLTAAQVVALAATTVSLGSSSQVAATSVNRAFMQIAKAAATGTPSLEEFANVAGYKGPQAAKQFANAFNQDAGNALAQFVTGLGKLQGNTLATNAILTQLGFTGQRGAQTLLQLAAGTRQNVNPMLDLADSMRLTEQAWQTNNELAKQAAIVYSSTASQIGITKNVIHDIGIGFGQVLLPALNMILKPIADVLWGFDQLPEPLKQVLTIVGALGGGFLLLGGAALALAPRAALVIGTLKEFGTALGQMDVQASTLVVALKQMASSEAEAANITAFSAARMSAAHRSAAVAAYEQANAERLATIANRGSALSAAFNSRAIELLVIAHEKDSIAAAARAQAEMVAAEAEQLAAKGAIEEAVAMNAAAVGHEEAAASAEMLAVAARNDAAAMYAAGDAALYKAAQDIKAAEADIALTVAEEEASAAGYAMGIAMDAATGPFAIAFIAITALIGVMGIFGHEQRKNIDQMQEQVSVNIALANVIRQSGNAASDSVRDWYLQNSAFMTLVQSVAAYKIGLEQLLSVVMGTASIKTSKQTFETLRKEYEAGNKAAGEQYNQLIDLANEHNAAAQAAQQQAKHESGASDAMKIAGDNAASETDKLNELAQAHDQINQAALDMPSALLGVQQAELAVKDAQDALAEAHRAGAKAAEDVRKAELAYQQALLDVKKAENDVAKARRAVNRAHQQEINNVADAQDKLADDTDKLFDAEDKVAEAEQALADLRAGPSMQEIIKATNKLADANIKLRNSQKKVQDAQYMLNYLMAEGASVRDVIDAQDELTSAQQDVANATADVTDAQQELTDVMTPASAEEIAAAERDLAAAQREVSAIQRQLVEDAQALKDARRDLRNDTLYKQAQLDLKTALIALDQAQLKVKDSQQALQDARNVKPARDVKEAELELMQAYLQLAEAHVQVKKDAALMRGEEFGAGREARALNTELGKLADNAAGPVRDKINQMRKALRGAVTDINAAKSAAGGGGAAAPELGSAPPATVTGDLAWTPDTGKIDLTDATSGILDRITGFFHAHGGDVADAFLSMFVSMPFGIIDKLTGQHVGKFLSHIVGDIIGFGPTIGHAFSTAWSFVYGEINKSIHWIQGHWQQIFGFLKDPFGSFFDWFAEKKDFITEKLGSVKDWVSDKWSEMSEHLKKPFDSFIGWLKDKWDAVTTNIRKPFDWVKDHWSDIKDKLTGPLGNAKDWVGEHWDTFTENLQKPFNWVRDHWSDIKDKITTPLSNAKDWIKEHVVDKIVDIFTGLPGRVHTALTGIGSFIKYPFVWAFDEIAKFWNATAGKFGFHAPSWIPGFGGKGWDMPDMTVLPLPALAEGGIATQATIAMVGEAGHEAIIPLDKMVAMFEPIDALALEMHAVAEALDRLVDLTAAGAALPMGGDHYEFHEVMADPVEIAREITWKKKVVSR